MQSQQIYGTTCYWPDTPPHEEIDGWDLPQEEQMWRRRDLPSMFDEVELTKDGDAKLTTEQKKYAAKEVDRCRNGFWFYNNGTPTYITGKHYFYLQWWKLEDDIYPDYRDADRRYFVYLNRWENVLWNIGIFRGKKRREGASSQATSNLVYECIFFTNSNCGLVSKTNIDSRDTFTDMVAFGYHQLPVFLKPRQLNRADSVTELVFAVKAEKGEVFKKGQRSKINYRAPVENAYDRGRISRILADEGGKWPIDVKFSKFISKVTKTMIKGAKRVGYCEAPSTVNELTKSGGAEFKKVWDNANQFKWQGAKTPNRFVTYFTPAYDNYEGFIDKYGMSVIETPTEEQYKFLVEKWVVKDPITGETVSEISEEDIKLGAKAYIYSRRKGLSGTDLEEEIRQNPCTVQEMFEAANTDCAFNSFNINKRKSELEANPVYKRRIKFFRNIDQTVSFRDVDEKDSFHWRITQLPPKGQENKKIKVDGVMRPARTNDGAIAIDSYTNTQGGKYGSKASAWIGRRFDMNDPLNTGKAIGWLYGRPKEKSELHEQVMLAAEYYGYKAWYERIADDYYTYFKERGKLSYLGRYPQRLIPKERKDKERDYGTPLDEFSLTKQLDDAVHYFEYYCHLIDFEELLDEALIFEPHNRTEYDTVVSFLILISCLMNVETSDVKKKEPLIKVYPNQNFASMN